MEIMNYMVDGPTTQPEGPVVQGHDQEREHSGLRRRSKSKNQKKTCSYSKKKRHFKSKCYKLQNKNKRARGQEKGQLK